MALSKSELREREPHRSNTSSSIFIDATKGNKDALLLSLDAGAAVDEMDSSRMTPLMRAAKCGHLDCVRLLIRRGADVHKRSVSGMAAAHYAASGGHTEVLLTLFDAGVAVDVDGCDKWTPPLAGCACIASKMDAASFALACGCRFALPCRELKPNRYCVFNRVVCGLYAVDCTL